MLTKLGNWVFHYRNYLFPIFYAALFIPSGALFENKLMASQIGLGIILTGAFIRSITIGLVYIIRGGKNRQIYAETLVTGGIYTVCRNPMYLGNILLLLGFGIFANSVIFMSVFFPLFCLFYLAIIKAEENFLMGKFGEQYIAFKKSTNTLIPNIFNIGKAFKGHQFELKKVIRKEYNSLFIYYSGIMLLLLYKQSIGPVRFAICLGFGMVIYLIIKALKRSGKLGK